jgi:hypothetical protein
VAVMVVCGGGGGGPLWKSWLCRVVLVVNAVVVVV